MPIIKVQHEVSEQFLMDCLTTAVESGGFCFWYWDDFAMVNIERDEELNVTSVEFTCDDGSGRSVHKTIYTRDVVKGIQRILGEDDGRVAPIDPRLVGYITRGVSDDDGGDIDAEAADVIMQVITFGEVVYG